MNVMMNQAQFVKPPQAHFFTQERHQQFSAEKRKHALLLKLQQLIQKPPSTSIAETMREVALIKHQLICDIHNMDIGIQQYSTGIRAELVDPSMEQTYIQEVSKYQMMSPEQQAALFWQKNKNFKQKAFSRRMQVPVGRLPMPPMALQMKRPAMMMTGEMGPPMVKKSVRTVNVAVEEKPVPITNIEKPVTPSPPLKIINRPNQAAYSPTLYMISPKGQSTGAMSPIQEEKKMQLYKTVSKANLEHDKSEFQSKISEDLDNIDPEELAMSLFK